MPSPPVSPSSSSSSSGLVPPPDAAADRRAALDVELFAQGARALTLARETRPKNTNKAYDPKQREWRVSRPSVEGRPLAGRPFFFFF